MLMLAVVSQLSVPNHDKTIADAALSGLNAVASGPESCPFLTWMGPSGSSTYLYVAGRVARDLGGITNTVTTGRQLTWRASAPGDYGTI